MSVSLPNGKWLSTYGLVQARLQFPSFHLLLEGNATNVVPFLTKLISVVQTVEQMRDERHIVNPANSHLPLQKLQLTLQPPTVVLPRTLIIVVHLLDIGHHIRQMRTLQRQRLVLVYKPGLNTLPDLLLGTKVGTLVPELLDAPIGRREVLGKTVALDIDACPLIE